MIVLGIESSCDETGVGVVRMTPRAGGPPEVELLADEIASSVTAHARFGGVVPEVASRAHLEAMVPTVERACAQAGVRLDDVDAVAGRVRELGGDWLAAPHDSTRGRVGRFIDSQNAAFTVIQPR